MVSLFVPAHRVRALLRRSDGAVTIDWVVLTAVAGFFGLVTIQPIWTGLESLVDASSATVGAAQLPSSWNN